MSNIDRSVDPRCAWGLLGSIWVICSSVWICPGVDQEMNVTRASSHGLQALIWSRQRSNQCCARQVVGISGVQRDAAISFLVCSINVENTGVGRTDKHDFRNVRVGSPCRYGSRSQVQLFPDSCGMTRGEGVVRVCVDSEFLFWSKHLSFCLERRWFIHQTGWQLQHLFEGQQACHQVLWH